MKTVVTTLHLPLLRAAFALCLAACTDELNIEDPGDRDAGDPGHADGGSVPIDSSAPEYDAGSIPPPNTWKSASFSRDLYGRIWARGESAYVTLAETTTIDPGSNAPSETRNRDGELWRISAEGQKQQLVSGLGAVRIVAVDDQGLNYVEQNGDGKARVYWLAWENPVPMLLHESPTSGDPAASDSVGGVDTASGVL